MGRGGGRDYKGLSAFKGGRQAGREETPYQYEDVMGMPMWRVAKKGTVPLPPHTHARTLRLAKRESEGWKKSYKVE